MTGGSQALPFFWVHAVSQSWLAFTATRYHQLRKTGTAGSEFDNLPFPGYAPGVQKETLKPCP